MSGAPKDVEGECNVWLLLHDDWGDNVATIRCGLPPGHEGLHEEAFSRQQGSSEQTVKIVWSLDESTLCSVHGRVEGPECNACVCARLDAEEAEKDERMKDERNKDGWDGDSPAVDVTDPTTGFRLAVWPDVLVEAEKDEGSGG